MSKQRTSPNPIYDETVQAAGFDPRDPEPDTEDTQQPAVKPPRRKPLGGRNG